MDTLDMLTPDRLLQQKFHIVQFVAIESTVLVFLILPILEGCDDSLSRTKKGFRSKFPVSHS